MDVVEFTEKAGYKILELSLQYNEEFNNKGVSCKWKDVYILSEAVDVVNDEVTSTDCINRIISRLDTKYQLTLATAPSEGGIGFMAIDPPSNCNVFTIYE